jgi:multidrug efflux system outer membrane protein
MFKQLRFRVSAVEAPGFRRFVTLFAGLCSIPMLTGCINAERPDLALEIPPAYGAAPGAPDSAPPQLDWWRGFGSAELTALIEEAQTANFDVAVAVARILQADAQSRVAGAPLLPRIDLDASATRSRASTAGDGGGAGDRSAYRAALTASYEIDFWGKNRAASRAAQETAIAARFNRDVVNLSTVVSVGTAYFLVLSSQDRLRTARSNLTSANRVMTVFRQRLEVGTASALDIAVQESVVATQRAAIPALDQTLRQNIATLAVLIGRPPASVRIRGGSLNRLAIPRVTPGLPSELLIQRPDIRLAEAQLASADASVESARAAFFPSISLTGQGGFQSSALKLLFTPEAAFYQVAANLTQPIFDGGRLQGQLELEESRQLEFLQNYRRSVVSAFGDVERALIAIADTAERERLQRQVVASSRRAFDIAETRLREGTFDLVTVLQTQQTLFQAQDNLAEARLARMQAILSLFQALGGSWLPRPAVEQAAVLQ